MNHIVPDVEFLGYIFVADSEGLASVSSTYLAVKATTFGSKMPNNHSSYLANS